MRVAVTFRNMDSSEALKSYASEKLGKINKYVHAPLEAEVTLSSEKHLRRVDLHVIADGHRIEGRETSEDMYASIDLAVDKIARQVRDAKETQTRRLRHGESIKHAG